MPTDYQHVCSKCSDNQLEEEYEELTVVSFSVSSPNPVRDEVTGWKFFTDESLTLIISALHTMSRK
jgi:hypothetical protein